MIAIPMSTVYFEVGVVLLMRLVRWGGLQRLMLHGGAERQHVEKVVVCSAGSADEKLAQFVEQWRGRYESPTHLQHCAPLCAELHFRSAPQIGLGKS